MDITFEDVAHVIQDARYQQAILETAPKPDKKIPPLPRSVNVPQFLEKYDIQCSTVMAEPLGRWFLGLFADWEERLNEFEKNLPAGSREEATFMEFVAAMHELRRQDPNETASFFDLLRLLRDADIGALGIVQDYVSDKKNKHATTIADALDQIKAGIVFSDEVDEQEVELLEEAEDSEMEEVDDKQPLNPAADEDDSFDAVVDPPPPEDLRRDDLVRNETQVSRYDPGKTQQRATAITRAARTTAGGGKMMMMTHTGTTMRPHSARSMDLNAAVQDLMVKIVSPIYQRLADHKTAFNQYIRFKYFAVQPISDRQIRYHRVLGQGAFGTVHGCIVAQTGFMLAMKIMSKKKIKLKHSKSQVVAERFALEALALHPSPYCMRLRYAYQTKDAFHLVLPLAIGGDLKYHLRQGPFDEKRAKFYAAEIALGVGHIHSLGFIMRDLKPRNILLDSEGHCKISDFGLAASIAEGRKVRGRAGTEGYWSPEVINQQHYGVDADWWSFGCCLFELLAGFNPFSCKHTGLQTRNEGTRSAQIKFTKHVPASAKPLIIALLDRNVDTRLGCRGEGVDEVLNARFAFWKGLDIGRLKRGEMPAPWAPEKGVIYAVSQSEMLENDDDPNGATLRRVKLTPDDIPEFNEFVDMESHMQDIVNVVPMNVDLSNLVAEAANKRMKATKAAEKKDRKKSMAPVMSMPRKSSIFAKGQKCVIS